jgi:hypothetical protein
MRRSLLATVVALCLMLVIVPGVSASGPGNSANAHYCQDHAAAFGYANQGACNAGLNAFQAKCESLGGVYQTDRVVPAGFPPINLLFTPSCSFWGISFAPWEAAFTQLDPMCPPNTVDIGVFHALTDPDNIGCTV